MCNNKEETTTSTTLWKFLENNTVEIPIIQRDYAQGRIGKEKLRETFLSDLKKALDNKKPLKLDFIYGSTENDVFQPLDGQQRLTTLWLLHWYIAYKAGKLSEVKETLGKFTYETRVSSREFCQKILALSADDEGNVVEHIKKQTWFYSEWLQDPTIQAILNMIGGTSAKRDKGEEIIDGLEEMFDKVTEYEYYWELLTGDNCPIQFYSLKLGNFGLTDDLYIKMNARGKPLTSFENLKADVIGYINDNEKCQNWEEKRLMEQNTEEEFKETFAYKIDTAWTDLFWKYKSDNYKIDDAFFNFFARYFLNYLIVNKEDSEEKIKENPLYIELYRSSDNTKKIEYNGFKNYETIFDEKCLKCLKKTLDNIAKHQSLFECFAPYWESSGNKEPDYYLIPQYEKDEIKGITDNGRVIFFAICRSFEQIDEQDEEKLKETLKQWMRVAWNIVENSDANLVGKLRLINELSAQSHSIYEILADEEKVIKSDFASEQVKEEREKAKKITEGNGWEEKIIEAEKTVFFKGSIRFLFRIGIDDDKNNIYDWSKFDERFEKAKRFFNEKGVAEVYQKDAILLRNLVANFDDWQKVKGVSYTYKGEIWKKDILVKNENSWIQLVNKLFDEELLDTNELEKWNTSFTEDWQITTHRDLVKTKLLGEILKGDDVYELKQENKHKHWYLHKDRNYVVFIGDKAYKILFELHNNDKINVKNYIISKETPFLRGVMDIFFTFNNESLRWYREYCLQKQEKNGEWTTVKNSDGEEVNDAEKLRCYFEEKTL